MAVDFIDIPIFQQGRYFLVDCVCFVIFYIPTLVMAFYSLHNHFLGENHLTKPEFQLD